MKKKKRDNGRAKSQGRLILGPQLVVYSLHHAMRLPHPHGDHLPARLPSAQRFPPRDAQQAGYGASSEGWIEGPVVPGSSGGGREEEDDDDDDDDDEAADPESMYLPRLVVPRHPGRPEHGPSHGPGV